MSDSNKKENNKIETKKKCNPLLINYIDTINLSNNYDKQIIIFHKLFNQFQAKYMDEFADRCKMFRPDSIDVAVFSIFLYTIRDYANADLIKCIYFLNKFVNNKNFAIEVLNDMVPIFGKQREYAEKVIKAPYPNYEEVEMEFYNLIFNKSNDIYARLDDECYEQD